MVVGTMVLVLWKHVVVDESMNVETGLVETKTLASYLYEIVPGFIANCLTIWVFNFVSPQRDESILKEYQAATE